MSGILCFFSNLLISLSAALRRNVKQTYHKQNKPLPFIYVQISMEFQMTSQIEFNIIIRQIKHFLIDIKFQIIRRKIEE